jgi:hypothetical protein
MTTRRPCHICRGDSVAEREIEVSRAGDEGFHTETAGYCARHIVGEQLGAFRVYERVSAAPCDICGNVFADGAFDAPPARTVCAGCYYSGAVHEKRPRIARLIERLRAAAPGAEVGVWHTGGGCFGLAVEWKARGGRLLFGTDGDAVPGEGEPFCVGRYADEQAWENGESDPFTEDVSDDDFVRLAADEERRI